MLVIAETPLVGLSPRLYRPDVLARARTVTSEMLRRDRHHPSVVLWSLANEPDIDSPEGDAFFPTLAADSRALDVTRRLDRIQAPVLLIWGANDPLFPVEQAERAHRLLPGSKLAVIVGAGHTPQAEKPEEFNRHLAAFLKR